METNEKNMTELNFEALEMIAGGETLDEDAKRRLDLEIRIYKSAGITLESVLKDMSRRSGNEEIRDYFISVWDQLKPLV